MFDLILNEAYFGKNNKNLKGVENAFQEIIDIYNKKNMSTTKYLPVIDEKTNLQITKIFSKIENLLIKEFNFEDVIISKSSSSPSVNACVFMTSVDKMVTNVNNAKTDLNGIEFKKPTIAMIMVINDNIFNGDFTAREITAILLHEVGHKFFPVNNYTFVGYTIAKIFMAPVSTLMINGVMLPIVGLLSKMKKMVRETTIYNSLDMIVTDINSVYYRIYNTLVPLKLIKKILKSNVNIINAVNPFEFFFGTRNEKFADSFATAYGYGPELASGLMKMKKGDGNLKDAIPGVRTIYDCTFTWLSFIIELIDCHPNVYQRAEDSLKYLKAESSKITDKRMKKEVDDQIKLLEITIKEFKETYPKQQLLEKQKPISAAISYLQFSILKGKAPQSLVSKSFNNNKDWEQFK